MPVGPSCAVCGHPAHTLQDGSAPAYAYLLGLYLGDGWLSRGPRDVYRLRILLDAGHPGIIQSCADAMSAVLPGRAVSFRRHSSSAAIEVAAYSKQWPCLIPQHGEGRKHLRRIALREWQRDVTLRHPEALLRGLIHSDGSRSLNTVRARVTGVVYRYPRYSFSNRSEDIKAIFCEHLDLIGIEWRRMGSWNISIARKDAVAALDRFVGPKR
jgi:hypothetical protein